MSATAEVNATETSHQNETSHQKTSSHAAPRGAELPTCPVCADSMIAAESSAFLAENVVSYLWTCDTCGYGFVTNHAVKNKARG